MNINVYKPLAYILVQCLAVCQKTLRCSLYCLATTASCGSSGSAADSNACKDSNTVRNVIAAALTSHNNSG